MAQGAPEKAVVLANQQKAARLKQTKPKKRAPKVAAPQAQSKHPDRYKFRLYVAGATDRSRQAILRAREVCAAELGDNFEQVVIDIYQNPILARAVQILATPTLVKEFPLPVRRLIGNLANATSLFVGLDWEHKVEPAR